ncbi:MAG TPA: tetratricopeptide repeat protein [Candidatus Binatia bacterium]|nr:tetratricopeptide repeat protein [Candidatus Binatia bacterium]
MRTLSGLDLISQATVRVCDAHGNRIGQGLCVPVEKALIVLTCYHVILEAVDRRAVPVTFFSANDQPLSTATARLCVERSDPGRDVAVLELTSEHDTVEAPEAASPALFRLRAPVVGVTRPVGGSQRFNARLAHPTPIGMQIGAFLAEIPHAWRLIDIGDTQPGISGSPVVLESVESAVIGLTHFSRAETEDHAREAYVVPISTWFAKYPELAKHFTFRSLERTQVPMPQRRTATPNVPDALRTHYFTGRDDLVKEIELEFTSQRCVALSGVGGIGKTQSAIRYVDLQHAKYPDGVYWANAETRGTLIDAFVQIAKLRGLIAAPSSEETAITARGSLERDGGEWLLVFDNVDDEILVRAFLPNAPHGHILTTTRNPVLQKLGIVRSLRVSDFSPQEAINFLTCRTGRNLPSTAESAAAEKIARTLAFFPLALEQAAAYIVATDAAFSSYLNGLQKQGIKLLAKARPEAHAALAITWSSNFKVVEDSWPASGDVLRVSAFWDPTAIPFELLQRGASVLGENIKGALPDHQDDLLVGELLRPLAQYSLISVDRQSRTFSIHRMVQEVVLNALPGDERIVLTGRAVSALAATFPNVDFKSWNACDRLVEHVEAVARFVDKETATDSAAGVFNKVGEYLAQRSRYAEALPIYKQALAIRERAPEPNFPDIGRSLNNLALLYRERAEYAKALLLFERALAIREQALGAQHVDVAQSLNDLALVYYDQQRFAKALPMWKRALAINERRLGLDVTEVAANLNNIAEVYIKRRQYSTALPLLKRALAIKEKELGPEDPGVAISLNNLATLYERQKRYAKALPLLTRALAINKAALGEESPEVGVSLNNLATLHIRQGQYAEALPLLERALIVIERELGPSHPKMAIILSNLAKVGRYQRKQEQALLYRERVQTSRKSGRPN